MYESNEVHLQQQSNIQIIEIQSKTPNKPHQKLQAKSNYTHNLVSVITNKTQFYNRSFQDAGLCFNHHLAY